MAHELWIETASGTASMFYVDEPPWHGLGKRLDNPATSAEAIRAANLDWKVSKQPLFVQQGQVHVPVQDRYAVMRPPGVGNRMRGVEGSLWAAYNGVTELIDHRQTKQDEDKRLNSIWFGDGYLAKARAFRVANEFLRAA